MLDFYHCFTKSIGIVNFEGLVHNTWWLQPVWELFNYGQLAVWQTWRFQFQYQNFPFLSNNILASPSYDVLISQLIQYARACSLYACFILRVTRHPNKLLGHGYDKERLKSSLRKCYGWYGDLMNNMKFLFHECFNDIL